MRTKRLVALVMAVALTVVAFSGCAGGGNTIKIGTIQPISGDISVFGVQSRDAVQMAVDEINAKGGVLNKKLELVIADDEANPEKTLSAFKRQATQDKIVGLVGALTSKCSLSITKEAQDRKIPMISPTSTNEQVTDAGDYVFRACYIDPFQGQIIAKFVIENLKGTKAAVLFDNTNDYSKGLKDNFVKTFQEMGGTIVAEEAYATKDKDFSAQITKIKGTNPDAIFLPDYYNTVALIAKQVRDAGITVPMLGGDGWDGIEAAAGDEIVGCYFSNHYSPDADDADVKNFVSAYKAKFNVVPNALAALAYDATYILAEAIAKAGSTDPAKIKAAMMETNRKFVTGQIKFNEKRNPVKSLVMVQIVKGDEPNKPKVVYAATVNP